MSVTALPFGHDIDTSTQTASYLPAAAHVANSRHDVGWSAHRRSGVGQTLLRRPRTPAHL